MFLSYAYNFLFGLLSIRSKFLFLNFVFSFPVYYAALGKKKKHTDCLIGEPYIFV